VVSETLQLDAAGASSFSYLLQPFSKRVNPSAKVALSIQSVQKALYPARLNQWDHPL